MGRTNPSARSLALREVLLLDPEDEWLRSKCCVLSKGYAGLWVDGRRVLLHRHLMGNPRGRLIDHRNGNILDCRKGNLRVATRAENKLNVGTPQRNNTSGFTGVSFHKQSRRWQASLKIAGRVRYLGTYPTPEEANQARLQAEAASFDIQPQRVSSHVPS